MKSDFTVTNQLVKEVISLPMHTELDDEQIGVYYSSTVINFINSLRLMKKYSSNRGT